MRYTSGSVPQFLMLVLRLLPGVGTTLLFFLAVIFFYELLKFIPPYVVKLIVDNLFLQPDLTYVLVLIGVMFGVYMVLSIIEISMLHRVMRMAVENQARMLERAFKKLLELPLSWHEANNTGILVSKMQKAAQYVGQFSWFITQEIIPICLQIILTGIVLLLVDWRVGLVYVVFTPLIVWSVDRQFRRMMPIREAYQEHYEEATKEFSQGLHNIQTVKDYVQEDSEYKKHSGHVHKFVDGNMQRVNFEYWQIAARDTLINVVRCLTLGLAVWLFFTERVSAGDVVLIFTLTEKAYINLHRLGRIYQFMGDTHEGFTRALAIQQARNPLEDKGTHPFVNGDVVFDDVRFAYGKDEVLKGISLNIPKQKITALLGASGSGKTTLVKLIMRHYDVQEGTIAIGGVPLQHIKLYDLRKNVAFVSQHTEIFDRTVFENIAYAVGKVSKQQVISAAKKAHAHKFIMQLPNGYDTLVGEKGIRLSGGQRQRISIARALLSKANIIIFDEATSSLDSESEMEIQNAVLSIRNKTLIIIAHRLSTVEHADHVVVLQEGEVVEDGSHDDLVRKKRGMYKRMRELQNLGELRK